MSVFETIPSNFFSILVSKNKEIYVEALLFLHKTIKTDGGLEILLEDYLTTLIYLQEERYFELEDDDEVIEIKITSSTKARLILNRLIKTGWIEREFLDGSFTEIITPKPYALPFMKLLSEVGDNTLQEYNSFVFSTYSGLKQANEDKSSQMYEAIISAKKNTEDLSYQLTTLYHSIRSHMISIENQIDINDILSNHFEEFKRLSDNMYHPIKTLDSIHRYMTPIQNILAEVLNDDEIMELICERAMASNKYKDISEAESDIVSMIDEVSQRYSSLDDVIDRIDRKHSQYTRLSIEKIQYLMNADHSVKGKLTDLLKAYANAEEDRKESIIDIMNSGSLLEKQEFLDNKSLYRKSARFREDDAQPLEVDGNRDFAEKSMEDMIGYFNKVYSVAKVREFVNDLFVEDRTEIRSSDIVLNSESEYILLILAVIRSSDKNMNYKIEFLDGKVSAKQYRIPNMVIRKKNSKSLN